MAKSKAAKKAKKALKKAKMAAKVVKAVTKEVTGKGDYQARTRVLRGRGDYADTIGKVVGDGIGGGVSWAAKKVGGFLSGLFGMGDYATHSEVPEQNTFVSGAAIPVQVHSTKDREFVFRGREEICDIFSSSAAEGVQVSYDINPGLEDFMEWLSQIAPAFSEWYPNGLVFEFVPAVSPQSADANGKVAMCISYDNGDPDPGSFKDISQYSMSIQFPPLKPGMMAGECKPALTALNWFKVRTGDVQITDEAHSLYDWGKVHVRTGGQANTGTLIGTLFVVYEIVFQKPLAPRPVGRTLTDVWSATTVSSAAYLGTARTARTGNTLGLTFSSNNTIVFPSWVNHGKFLVTLEVSGSAAVIANPTVTYTGCSALAWNPGGAAAFNVPAAGVNSTFWSFDVGVDITAASATIAFSAGTIPTASNATLWVTALDTDVTVLNRRKNHYESYWKLKEDEKLQEMKYVDDSVDNKFREIMAYLQELERAPTQDDRAKAWRGLTKAAGYPNTGLTTAAQLRMAEATGSKEFNWSDEVPIDFNAGPLQAPPKPVFNQNQAFMLAGRCEAAIAACDTTLRLTRDEQALVCGQLVDVVTRSPYISEMRLQQKVFDIVQELRRPENARAAFAPGGLDESGERKTGDPSDPPKLTMRDVQRVHGDRITAAIQAVEAEVGASTIAFSYAVGELYNAVLKNSLVSDAILQTLARQAFERFDKGEILEEEDANDCGQSPNGRKRARSQPPGAK
jgi:hypothetical protein